MRSLDARISEKNVQILQFLEGDVCISLPMGINKVFDLGVGIPCGSHREPTGSETLPRRMRNNRDVHNLPLLCFICVDCFAGEIS